MSDNPFNVYIAGHFSGDIKLDGDGNPDFNGVDFHLGEKSLANIGKIIPILNKKRFVDIGKSDSHSGIVDDFKGGKSIKKRVRKNRKTKKTRRNRK